MNPNNKLQEKKLNSQLIHKSSFLEHTIDSVTLPNGNSGTREVIWHPGGVVVIPYTNDKNLVLVEQFRYATGKTLLEFPAGRLEPNEPPKEAAIRELKEETGYTAGKMLFLNSIYPAPGFCSECLHIYFAMDLKQGEQNLDKDEFLNLIHIPKDNVIDKVKSRQIQDAKTLASLSLIQSFNLI